MSNVKVEIPKGKLRLIHKKIHNSIEMKNLIEFIKNSLDEYSIDAKFNIEVTIKEKIAKD